MIWSRSFAALFALTTFAAGPMGCGSSPRDPGRGPIAKPAGPGDPIQVAKRRTRGTPKPLSKTIDEGLTWLVRHQLASGGWGQGDEAEGMGAQMKGMAGASNVADTSMALLAFLRAGHDANHGAHRDAVQRGLAYVLAEVEASDDTSLAVSAVTGTRVQAKIGPYADTFAALLVLSEARGTMRDGVANARLDQALRKIVKKIETNQRSDGTWDGEGWAPVLSQALAAKGMNRAAQNGIQVSEAVIDRLEAQAHSQVNVGTGSFSADGAAGIGLYGGAAATSAARESANTRQDQARKMKAQAAKAAGKELKSPDAPTKAEIARAEGRAAASDAAASDVEAALITNLDSPQFRGGFGNNGGEEFLSYMMISESLVMKGGEDWAKWDTAITALVDGVQNEDGSWSGHHCITGRTFCTAAALLVLMGDRTPAPEAAIAS